MMRPIGRFFLARFVWGDLHLIDLIHRIEIIVRQFTSIRARFDGSSDGSGVVFSSGFGIEIIIPLMGGRWE